MLLTAYADTDAAIEAINRVRLDYYVLKPWDPPEERLYPVLGRMQLMARSFDPGPPVPQRRCFFFLTSKSWSPTPMTLGVSMRPPS